MLRGLYRWFVLGGLVFAAAPQVSGQLNQQDMKRLSWREIGPSATGGRIVDIEVDPRKTSRIYAAAASGGLWKSENNGTTWTALFQQEETISIGDVALDPSRPDVIWIGTGEANNQRSSLWGDGVYKSEDAGKTFQNMGLRDSHHIGRIVVHPRDSRVVYVAALGHLYSPNEERGLFQTTDGGATWKKVLYINPDVGVVDVALDPNHPEIVFAASYERRRRAWDFDGAGPGSAIYRSRDSGRHWTRLEGGLPAGEIGRIGLAIYPKNPNVIFATVSNQNQIAADAEEPRGGPDEAPGAVEAGDFLESVERAEFEASQEPAAPTATVANEPSSQEDDPQPQDRPPAPKRQTEAAAAPTEPSTEAPPQPPAGAARGRGMRGRGGQRGRGGRPTGRDGAAATAQQRDQAAKDDEPSGDDRPPATTKTSDMTKLGLKFAADKDGVFVEQVGGPAARSGIRTKDRVVSLGGMNITDLATLEAAIEHIRDGDMWTVVARRGDQQQTYSLVAPARRPREVGGEVYRSDDGGETWVKQNRTPVGGSPAYYYGQIYVDPQDDQRLFVLGVPVYSSTDGGKTWNTNAARSVHVDHHALWIDPANPDHLLLGNDGGLHASYDGGATWDHIYNLPLAQFYAIGVDMQDPYHVYGGLQDNGTYAGPSSGGGRGVGRFDWRRVGGGDGFYVQVDPQDAGVVFYESQFGALQRSKNGQRSFIRPPQSDPAGPADRYNWNSPILMSRHDSRVIYFGGNKLFKSFNQGDDWLTISDDLTTANPSRIAGNVPYCTITTIAESPRNRNLLLVGTDDGNVQWTSDGGKTWTNLLDRFPMRPGDWWTSRVVLSHHDEKVAYVAFTGYREDDFRPFVFMTADSGQTWKSIVSDLPVHGPVNVIQEDPRNARVLYCGADFGVFVSIDQGGSWLPLSEGLPRVAVHDLLVHPREHDLVIGTHGRGIFTLNATMFSETPAADAADKAFLFPIRDLGPTPRVDSGLSISGDRRYVAADPTSSAEIYFHLKEEVKSLTLEVLNKAGESAAKLQARNEPGLQKVQWNPRGGGRGGRGGRFGGGRGGRGGQQAAAPPGTYTVVLKAGDEEHRREITIK